MVTHGTMWTIAVLATAWGIGAPVAATTPGLAPVALLTVSSDPVGATVYVDGRVVGRTPVDVPALPAGDHRVRLVREGYLEHSRIVKMGRDKSETLHVRLTRATPGAARQSGGLRIVVIEGEDAVNIIQQKTAVAPVVEVRDRNNLPVPGALVTFTIGGGKSAAFAGGAQTLTVTTNAAGRATAAALNPLSSGSVQIQVQAAFQGQTAAATITQTNVMTAAQAASVSAAGAAGGGGLGGLTIAGIVGAVGAGAVLATSARGGDSAKDSTTATTPTTPTTPTTDPAVIAAAGTYILQQIDGQPLPALTVLSPPNPCPIFTDSGTLKLTANPQVYELSERSHMECRVGPGMNFNSGNSGSWSVQGGTITFTPGGTGQFFIGPGTLSGTTLTFAFDAPHASGGNPPLRVTSTWRK